jgi:hypothetical protein
VTTAALLQATSVVQNTIIASAFTMAGAPGGFFDTTPTNTIVSVFSMSGSGTLAGVTQYRALAPAALVAPGVGAAQFEGFTIVTGVVASALTAAGVATLHLIATDAQLPPELPAPILVRFITGPQAGVIPVEIVDQPGPDVVEVILLDVHDNYVPIVEDPTNPMRKKVHFRTP